MTAQTDREQVKTYVSGRLRWLLSLPEHPQKAALANLRRGVGRMPGDLPAIWGIFLQDLPPELESKTGAPTRAEWAIYLALTLYALHQQGHALPGDNMNREGARFGFAVRQLVKPGEQPQDSSILRRFNALATAASMREGAQHLRGIVQLLRADGIPLDYAQLAADLYDWQSLSAAPRVRLQWGQDYYRPLHKENDASPIQENGEENKDGFQTSVH